jgi:hypothetical protein
VRRAQVNRNAQAFPKPHKGAGKIPVARAAHEASVAVEGYLLGQSVLVDNLKYAVNHRFGIEVRTRSAVYQDRCAFVHHVEDFDHVGVLAVRFYLYAGAIFEVDLPTLERFRTLPRAGCLGSTP